MPPVTGTLVAQGTFVSEAEGSTTISLQWVIAAGVENQVVDLASGFNALTAPAGSTLAIIVPPTTNTQTITAKGVTGDTGIPLSKVLPSIVAIVPGSTWGLTAGGIVSGLVIRYI